MSVMSKHYTVEVRIDGHVVEDIDRLAGRVEAGEVTSRDAAETEATLLAEALQCSIEFLE